MANKQTTSKYLHSSFRSISIKIDKDISVIENPELKDITVLPGVITGNHSRREFLRAFGKGAAALGMSSIFFSGVISREATAGSCPSHIGDACQCQNVGNCQCNQVGVCTCNQVCTCMAVRR